MQKACVLIAVLAACGNDHSHMTTIVGDSGQSPDARHIDADTSSGPNLVNLRLFGDPDLIVYRDGTGAWHVPTASTAGQYQLHVTDDYQVVVVCSYGGLTGNIDSEQLNATYDDGDAPYMFCSSGDPGTTPTTVAVTGQMLQPGTVTMADSKSSTTAPWSYALDVSPGTHDLVAVGATKMLIRRDLAIAAATSEADIDLATSGADTTNATLTINGTNAGDQTTTEVELFTTNEYVTVSSTINNTVQYPPDSLLLNTDFAELAVRNENAAHTQFRTIYTYPTQQPVTLLPVLTGASFTAASPIVAHWSTLPAYTDVTFQVYGGNSTSFLGQVVRATQRWIEKKGATSLAFETTATGYDAAWSIDPAQAYASFEVLHSDATGSFSTGIENTVEVTTLRTRVQRTARRARLAAFCNKHTSICKERVLRAIAQK